MEGSPEISGVTLVAGGENAKETSDSATGATSCCTPCGAKASKGTSRSGADAVPKMSSGSRFRYLVREIVCRPETTKCPRDPGRRGWSFYPPYNGR